MHKGLPMLDFCRHEVERSVIHEAVQGSLKKVAETMTFRLSDADPLLQISVIGFVAKPVQVPSFIQKASVSLELRGNWGPASVTVINNSYLSSIKHLLLNPAQKRFKILKTQLEMSLTLCHETLHALNLAIDSDLLKIFMRKDFSMATQKVDYNEPLYLGQRVAGLGFFWESDVLVGCLTAVSLHNDNYPVMVSEWPMFERRDPEEYPGTGFSFAYLSGLRLLHPIRSESGNLGLLHAATSRGPRCSAD